MTFTLRNPAPARRSKPARTLEEAGVLAEARAAKVDADAAEARKLVAAVAWAQLHEVDEPTLAETWAGTPVSLSGEGAPLIATGCVGELAAVLGMSTNGGRAYLADAVELAHRLPTVYARILSGKLPVWRGRRIARETVILPPDVAADLDIRIAPLASRLSARATQQMIDDAIRVALPTHFQSEADALEETKVVVDHRQVSFIGTSRVYGALDLADALDLDETLNRTALALAEAGDESSLDARRAKALGMLARGETATGPATPRAVTLYVHLPADGSDTALVENGAGPHLLTQERIASWLGKPEVTVVVKPVIELDENLTSLAYVVPDRIKEQVELRDRTCIFAHCIRQARLTQKDHTRAYDEGGATESDNLGCLCQHHHNLKTHAGWTYTRIDPTTYLWQSPHGYQFLRDRYGTEEFRPSQVSPDDP